jgi:hypothetical protein
MSVPGSPQVNAKKSFAPLDLIDKCFGCQGLHPYMRNKVIVCPNKDKPGVREAANMNYKEWLECRKKLNKKRKEKSISYKKLSD